MPPDVTLQITQYPAQHPAQHRKESRLVSDPFDPMRPPHDPGDLPPGASPSPHKPDEPVPEEASFLPGELSIGSGKGGKRGKKAVLWEVIRPLSMPDDLPLLSQSLPAPRATITQIRHSHHQLAQMLATGTKHSECSLITGYSPTYISILKTDPTFQELIEHYSSQREMLFVDVIERMRSLGLSTLDELQSRMEDDASQFTNRELHEQAELLLVKPMAATRGLLRPGEAAAQGAGGVQVNVNFVKAADQPQPSAPTITIDMEPNK
jgi:hypothetical protein